MTRLLLITLLMVVFVAAPQVQAQTAVEKMIREKRARAQADRLEAMQKIQHKQANPQAYLAAKYTKTEDKVTFSAANDGHYYVPVSMDGREIRFLADTGATSIFMSQSDAKRIGINISSLNYNRRYQTANGATGAAAVAEVKNLQVGPITLRNVPVTVSQENSHMALLGMEFFNRVSKYSVEDGKLTIYK